MEKPKPTRLPVPEYPIGTVVMRKRPNGIVLVETITMLMWLPEELQWKYCTNGSPYSHSENELSEYVV